MTSLGRRLARIAAAQGLVSFPGMTVDGAIRAAARAQGSPDFPAMAAAGALAVTAPPPASVSGTPDFPGMTSAGAIGVVTPGPQLSGTPDFPGMTAAGALAVTSPPALTAQVIKAEYDLVNRSTYTTGIQTGSFTPPANTLITIDIASTGGTTNVSSVSGCGLTWVNVGTINTGNSIRLSRWRACGASPSDGNLSIGFGTTQTACYWNVVRWDGAVTTGSDGADGIVQTTSTTLSGTQSSVNGTLAALQSANNAHLFFIARNRSDGCTVDSDFTGLGGVESPGESINCIGGWAINQTTFTSTFPSASQATCSLSTEIKAAA